jgi:thiol-disulfide isomerase/thioredoxin
MKKFALLIILFCFTILVNAQSNTQSKLALNEHSIVRGEDGLVYPYTVWKKLMATGNYGIRNRKTVDEQNRPEYLLYELTELEKKDKLGKLPKPKVSDVLVEGEDFKGFRATDINGNKYDLRKVNDKVIVLNFWFSNGQYSRKVIPDLNKLVDEFKGNDKVLFLSIANDDKLVLKDFLKENPFSYNIIADGRDIAQKLGIKSYPTHAVLNQKGKIIFSSVGSSFSHAEWIKKAINEALASN